MPAGRPTKYLKEYAEKAYKLCLLGAKDTQLADFFGVTVSTLFLWKEKHKEFSEALKDGKEKADAEIANSLYHRAMGYSHEEDKIFCNASGDVTTVKTTKHYAPDTTAAIFWLKNRRSDDWRDKKEVDVNHKNDPSELTDSELADIATGSSTGTAEQADSKKVTH